MRCLVLLGYPNPSNLTRCLRNHVLGYGFDHLTVVYDEKYSFLPLEGLQQPNNKR